MSICIFAGRPKKRIYFVSQMNTVNISIILTISIEEKKKKKKRPAITAKFFSHNTGFTQDY